MSYDVFQEARRQGGASEVYIFRVNEDRYLGYTNDDKDRGVSYEGQVVTCKAVPIKRGKITSTGALGNSANLTLNVPRSSEIAEMFAAYPPSTVVTVDIYRQHREDRAKEYKRVWYGRVLSREGVGPESQLICDPFLQQMKRPALRTPYSYECTRFLYGPACKAERVPFVLTVVSVSGQTVVLSSEADLAGKSPAFFVGGTAEWAGERGKEVRLISNCAADAGNVSASFAGPTSFVEAGTEITLFMSCDHTMESCSVRHNNIQNYGGQPWIPLINPIGKLTTYF